MKKGTDLAGTLYEVLRDILSDELGFQMQKFTRY